MSICRVTVLHISIDPASQHVERSVTLRHFSLRAVTPGGWHYGAWASDCPYAQIMAPTRRRKTLATIAFARFAR